MSRWRPTPVCQPPRSRRIFTAAFDLQPLRSERDHSGKQEGEARQLRIALDANCEGAVRLHYQVAGPTWASAYRATPDHQTGTVDIEHQAQVSQRSRRWCRGRRGRRGRRPRRPRRHTTVQST